MANSHFSDEDKPGNDGSDKAAQHLKEYWNKAKDKAANFMDDVKKDPKLSEAVNLARTHRKETLFIVLLAIGILISFFHFLGGLLVGAVSTVCLPWDLNQVWKKISAFYDEKGQFKSIILGLIGLYLLLHIPSFLIGGILGLVLNLFMQTEGAQKAKKDSKQTKDDIKQAGKEGADKLEEVIKKHK